MSSSKFVGALVVIVVILLVAGYFGYSSLKNKHNSDLTAQSQAVSQLNHEKELLAQNNKLLNDEIEKLNTELESVHGFDLPLEKIDQALGLTAQDEEPLNRVNLPFRLNNVPPDKQVEAFFNYLDRQPYVQAQTKGVKTYALFVKNVDALGKTYPKVAQETKVFFEMMRNISYFFRTLGKTEVELAQSVLVNEHDIMEPVMAAFYGWFTAEDPELKGRPDLRMMYEYSDYLLNSFGGRAYLVRRSSKVRLLSLYYCVLTVDRASDNNMNYNGIDIRPYIDPLLDDMRTQMGFINRDEYISKLETLKAKYQRN